MVRQAHHDNAFEGEVNGITLFIMADFFKRPKPVVLISMDGVGVAQPGPGNAVTLADTKNLDKLWPSYPHTYLEAAGLHVGLPSDADGNSEVGHMTIGAGKVIFQDLPRIDNAIKNNGFYSNQVLIDGFEFAKKNKGNVHFMGLLGDGVVHSSFEHLVALLELAKREKIDPDSLFIHCFTDGRDSSPTAGSDLLEKLESYCIQKRIGRVATIIGRTYAMDRDRRWEKTKRAYDLLVNGIGTETKNWKKTLEEMYKKHVTDEYMEPLIVATGKEKPPGIKEGDCVVFFNFRADRATQITKAFEDEKFTGFERTLIKNLYFVGFTEFEDGFPKKRAFPPEEITNPLGKVLSDKGLKQLRISESEKFPHVTYFFNGGNPNIWPGEVWLEIPSPKDVATYDLKPEMSQKWVTDVLIEKIEKDEFDLIVVNFAGPDMVAHTGVLDATIKAMEVCDECVGRIVQEVLKKDGAVVITADHGNAEEMINVQTGEPDTKHSTNQVPFIVIKKGLDGRELSVGGLADVAPTILKIMGIEQPADMTGRDLLI